MFFITTWRYIFISILLIILLTWLIIYPYIYPQLHINTSLIIFILGLLNIFYGINTYEKINKINTITTKKLVNGWRLLYLVLLLCIIINNVLILPIFQTNININYDIINSILTVLSISFGLRTIEKSKGVE